MRSRAANQIMALKNGKHLKLRYDVQWIHTKNLTVSNNRYLPPIGVSLRFTNNSSELIPSGQSAASCRWLRGDRPNPQHQVCRGKKPRWHRATRHLNTGDRSI